MFSPVIFGSPINRLNKYAIPRSLVKAEVGLVLEATLEIL
jgi:hypothetical protein